MLSAEEGNIRNGASELLSSSRTRMNYVCAQGLICGSTHQVCLWPLASGGLSGPQSPHLLYEADDRAHTTEPFKD